MPSKIKPFHVTIHFHPRPQSTFNQRIHNAALFAISLTKSSLKFFYRFTSTQRHIKYISMPRVNPIIKTRKTRRRTLNPFKLSSLNFNLSFIFFDSLRIKERIMHFKWKFLFLPPSTSRFALLDGGEKCFL